jgi:TrmH family RNA methyltransferase
MGAVLRTQPQSADTEEILAYCAENAIDLAVTALSNDAEDLRTAEPGRYAVVIGSEGQGVRTAFIQNAKKNLVIPMTPRCESLNAAVAAAIVMWEMRR